MSPVLTDFSPIVEHLTTARFRATLKCVVVFASGPLQDSVDLGTNGTPNKDRCSLRTYLRMAHGGSSRPSKLVESCENRAASKHCTAYSVHLALMQQQPGVLTTTPRDSSRVDERIRPREMKKIPACQGGVVQPERWQRALGS